MSLADTIVAAALELDGLAYGSDPERALSVLYPFDKRGHAVGFLAGYPTVKPKPVPPHYTCGVTCWAVLRRAGASGVLRGLGGRDFLREPYGLHLQLAIRRLRQLADEHGLWCEPTPGGEAPEASDIVLIGASGALRAAYGGDEHVLTVTGPDESIDGGQPDHGNRGYGTACRRVERRMVWHGRALWLERTDGGGARRVQGWLKAGALPCHEGA
jgi:hypothetical protein